MSPNMGSGKSMSEEGSDKETQSYTTSSLQLLDLMDTLFSRYGFCGVVGLLYQLMCCVDNSLYFTCRIGRIFTKEAVMQLQHETVTSDESNGAASMASCLEVSQDCIKMDKSSQVMCGGLLWQMAWCPLLQVNHIM